MCQWKSLHECLFCFYYTWHEYISLHTLFARHTTFGSQPMAVWRDELQNKGPCNGTLCARLRLLKFIPPPEKQRWTKVRAEEDLIIFVLEGWCEVALQRKGRTSRWRRTPWWGWRIPSSNWRSRRRYSFTSLQFLIGHYACCAETVFINDWPFCRGPCLLAYGDLFINSRGQLWLGLSWWNWWHKMESNWTSWNWYCVLMYKALPSLTCLLFVDIFPAVEAP